MCFSSHIYKAEFAANFTDMESPSIENITNLSVNLFLHRDPKVTDLLLNVTLFDGLIVKQCIINKSKDYVVTLTIAACIKHPMQKRLPLFIKVSEERTL